MQTESVEMFPLKESFVFKLLKVPVEHDLYTIVEALKGKLSSIMSIYRVYDYENQQRCNEVVVVVRNELEYMTLKEMKRVLIKAQDVEMDFSTAYFGSATCSKYVKCNNEWDVGPSPISIKVDNLLEVSRITTIYLSKILLAFESTDNRDVTGITFLYDNKRDAIRPFGFVSFINVNAMLKYHKKHVRLWEQVVQCESSCQIPYLLSRPNMTLIQHNPKEFCKDICFANQLNSVQSFTSEMVTSLPSSINEMHIAETTSTTYDEPMSDSDDSILSLELDYEYDDELNLVKK
jgi:hypothetical protein